jgi:hypothetical protein
MSISTSACLCLVIALCGCNNGQAVTANSGEPGPHDWGCKPLGTSRQTLADIERDIERTQNDTHEGGKKLSKGAPCGEYEVAHVSNGFAGHTYYLKDGVVIGISYGDDGGGKNCYGTIPSCK